MILGFRWSPFNPTYGNSFLKAKALGFTRFLLDVVSLERVVFFYDFRVSVVSVQPNLRELFS